MKKYEVKCEFIDDFYGFDTKREAVEFIDSLMLRYPELWKSEIKLIKWNKDFSFDLVKF